ncbi:MAG: potassium transporter TrkG [Turneriella sp.]
MRNWLADVLGWATFLLVSVFAACLAWETGFLPEHVRLPLWPYQLLLVLAGAFQLAALILRNDPWRISRQRRHYPIAFSAAAAIVSLAVLLWLSDEHVARRIIYVLLAIETLSSMASRISLVLRLRLRPQMILAVSFLAVIILGTLALLMPNSTTRGISLINALFTSVSAVCVTGLTVVDTATAFTMLGKVIILCLIQVGGLGIVMISYLLISLVRMNISIQEKIHLREFFTGDSRAPLARALKTVLFMVIGIELVSAGSLYLAWQNEFPQGQAAVYAVFHAVSAFCNAGFSLFPQGYENPVAKGNAWIVSITGLTIFLGSVGFLTQYDVLALIKARWQRRRYRLSVSSRIVLTSSFILVLSAAFLFWLGERNNALAGLPAGDVILHSFFQSVTLRTAGFSTLNFAAFAPATLLFMLFFMFIGGASISTAGGVKINTVVATLLAVRMTLKADRAMNLGGRRIPFAAVNKALAILFSATVVLAMAILLLAVTEPVLARNNLVALVFEAFSALGTVGLSTGITAELTDYSKLILSAEMFVGRIGPMTLALLLTRPERFTDYEFPDEDLTVG